MPTMLTTLVKKATSNAAILMSFLRLGMAHSRTVNGGWPRIRTTRNFKLTPLRFLTGTCLNAASSGIEKLCEDYGHQQFRWELHPLRKIRVPNSVPTPRVAHMSDGSDQVPQTLIKMGVIAT
jgi:hypothetical protein